MKKIWFIFLSVSARAEWIHFKDQVSDGDANVVIRKHEILAEKKKSNPMRFSVSEKITGEKRLEILKEPQVAEIKESEESISEGLYYSPWKVAENDRSKWTYITGLSSFGVLTFWGSAAWNWGTEDVKFGFGDEGWFNKNSYTGGADKIGHMFSLHYQTRVLYFLFINMGWGVEDANLLSAFVAEGLGIALEIGDGFSRYRFAWDDLVVDSLGVAAAYLFNRYPSLDELLGFRIEWWPSKEYRSPRNEDKTDITSDYNGMKFFLDVRASGIPSLKDIPIVKYLTFDFGYYTRGYEPDITPENKTDGEKGQFWTVGLGLNLSKLVFDQKPESKFVRGASTLFKYYTPPRVIYGTNNKL